jgi:hypothetical protein
VRLIHEQNARLSTRALILIENIVQVTSDASKGHIGYIRSFGPDEGVVVRGGLGGDYLGEIDPERVR